MRRCSKTLFKQLAGARRHRGTGLGAARRGGAGRGARLARAEMVFKPLYTLEPPLPPPLLHAGPRSRAPPLSLRSARHRRVCRPVRARPSRLIACRLLRPARNRSCIVCAAPARRLRRGALVRWLASTRLLPR